MYLFLCDFIQLFIKYPPMGVGGGRPSVGRSAPVSLGRAVGAGWPRSVGWLVPGPTGRQAASGKHFFVSSKVQPVKTLHTDIFIICIIMCSEKVRKCRTIK